MNRRRLDPPATCRRPRQCIPTAGVSLISTERHFPVEELDACFVVKLTFRVMFRFLFLIEILQFFSGLFV